nr:coiled-coil domain-containing protein 174 [Leptinotarsa decemlineata]
MSTYEISKSSLLSLKAEILRKQQELTKAKFDNEVKVKILKKNTPLEIKNKGIESRIRNDECPEDEDLLKQSRSALEYKADLYEKLSSGSTAEDKKIGKRFLVRFDKKKPKVSDLPPSGSEDEDKLVESDDDYYQSDDDINITDPGEKFVDYVDCFGRTRKCLQKDLEYLKSNDEELRKVVEEKRKQNQQQSLSEDNDFNKDNSESRDEIITEKEKEVATTNPVESELLSSDMRREMLRKQWEAEEEELRNKSNIHYQDILFAEARTHGVGYYSFSKDEEERLKQQQALKKLREETEQKQKKAQELKVSREKLLAARIKAAKNRKRARMGLPPEEDEPEPPPEPEITEEERKKQEEIKLKEQMREQILEEARKNHLRPWDIGKEGVKEHYVMTQEEWVEKKRDERPAAFAPPSSDRKDFRSCEKKFEMKDIDRSLKFSTKKIDGKRQEKGTLAGLNPYKSRYRNSNPQEEEYDEKPVNTKLTKKMSDFEEIAQDARMSPRPIVDLTEAQELEFDDRLLGDYNKVKQNMNQIDSNESERGKGVEIAPPPSFEYYGPSQKKIKRSPTVNMFEDSIEAGLKFLRKQVEEKEKPPRHPKDLFLF